MYALSVGVKDVRLMGWVLDELSVAVRWPMKIWCNSTGAISFKDDTCPVSKIRGVLTTEKTGWRSSRLEARFKCMKSRV